MFYYLDIATGEVSMRLLALAFPRLPVQVARSHAPELAGRPFAVLSGEGEGALIAAASPEASAAGIERGMLASAARGCCRNLAVIPANAGDCLDALEQAASILRIRATPNVVMGGHDHLLVDLGGLESRFAGEQAAATALAALIRSWTRLDVRAGVGGDAVQALAAARTARRLPFIAPIGTSEPTRLAASRTAEIVASLELPAPAPAIEWRTRIARTLVRLETILAGRDESFRGLSLTVSGPAGDTATLQVSSHEPMHSAADAMAILAPHLAVSLLDGAMRIDLALRHPGPSMRVEPLVREPAASRVRPAGFGPWQPLLRAS